MAEKPSVAADEFSSETQSDGGANRRDSIELLGIDHVQVAAPAGSEEAARSFYGGLLGLPELRKPEPLRARGGVWFACGAHQLHVGIAEPFAPATKAHPALAVAGADLDRLAMRLARAGQVVQWDVAIPGTRRFYTADPWGNRIELVGTEGEVDAETPTPPVAGADRAG